MSIPSLVRLAGIAGFALLLSMIGPAEPASAGARVMKPAGCGEFGCGGHKVPRGDGDHRPRPGKRIPGIGGGIIITIPTQQPEFESPPEVESPPQEASCPSSMVFSRKRGRCVCGKGLQFRNGECVPPVKVAECGPNEFFSKNRGRCVCRKGFQSVGGECVPPIKVVECGPNEFFSKNRGRCLCRKGFDRVGDACRPPVIIVKTPRPPVVVVEEPVPVVEEPAVEPVQPQISKKPTRETPKIAAVVAKRKECLAPDLYDLLKETYGRAPAIDRCEAACIAKPVRFSEPELAEMSKRFGIEWCESCIRIGGYLPLADIQRIEQLAGITLCPDGARLCAAPSYTRVDPAVTRVKIVEVFSQLPATLGKEGDIAVVIGNDTYGNGTIAHPNGQSDAEAISTLLIGKLGYRKENVIDLRNATLADFRRVFGGPEGIPGELATLYGSREKGDIFIYISSHGLRDEASGKSYLLPVDAKQDDPAGTGYSLDDLYASLGKIGARTIMLALEASFGTSLSSYIDPPNLPELEASVMPEAQVPGLAVYTASDRDQRPLDDPEFGLGLFTRYLIEGLAGKADASPTGNDDRRIDSVELYVYTANMVRTAARKSLGLEQKPQLSKTDNLLIGRLAAK